MLSLEDVSVAFNAGTANEVRALQQVSLSIADGEFVTVIGANGAGKSSLFNVVAGTAPVDSGRIVLDGQDITRWPEYRRSRVIGRVFQDPARGSCPGLTIRENLSLAAIHGRNAGLAWDVKEAHDDWFIERLAHEHLGLEYRLDTDVSMLSGGQRQAITLVMATLIRPRLLLLDEHTAALDPHAAGQVIALTRELAESQDLTVIMITHSMQQACTLGERIIMMHQGRVEFDLSGAERRNLRPADLVERFDALEGEAYLPERAPAGPR